MTKFISTIMRGGKPQRRANHVQALDIVKDRWDDPLQGVQEGRSQRHASLEVSPRRVGGSNYQVPVEVTQPAAVVAIRWVSSYAVSAATADEQESWPQSHGRGQLRVVPSRSARTRTDGGGQQGVRSLSVVTSRHEHWD